MVHFCVFLVFVQVLIFKSSMTHFVNALELREISSADGVWRWKNTLKVLDLNASQLRNNNKNVTKVFCNLLHLLKASAECF